MLDFPRWKTIGISIILLFGIVFAIPSFLPEKTFDKLPSFAQIKVNLGLDLAGGSHLLLEADTADLQKTQIANMEKTVRAAMRGERGADDDIAIGELSTAGGKISFLVRDQAKLDEARDRLFKETGGAGMTGPLSSIERPSVEETAGRGESGRLAAPRGRPRKPSEESSATRRRQSGQPSRCAWTGPAAAASSWPRP